MLPAAINPRPSRRKTYSCRVPSGTVRLSVLNLIHVLRPDIIKLVMKLVRNVDRDPYKARITANLLDIANARGIDALAESIETEGELAWVQQHGAKCFRDS